MFVIDTQCHQNNIKPQHLGVALAQVPRHVSGECINLNSGVLFARPLNSESVIDITALVQNYDDRLNNIHHPIVLSTLDNMNIFFEGDWMVEMLSMSQAATLFSFLDYQAESRRVLTELCVGEKNTYY